MSGRRVEMEARYTSGIGCRSLTRPDGERYGCPSNLKSSISVVFGSRK